MTTKEAIKTLTSPGIKKGTPREHFDELMSATEAIGIVLRAAEENEKNKADAEKWRRMEKEVLET